MKVNQTIRENMIVEIKHNDLILEDVAKWSRIDRSKLNYYIFGDEGALNGEEIQRVFNYLHKQK